VCLTIGRYRMEILQTKGTNMVKKRAQSGTARWIVTQTTSFETDAEAMPTSTTTDSASLHYICGPERIPGLGRDDSHRGAQIARLKIPQAIGHMLRRPLPRSNAAHPHQAARRANSQTSLQRVAAKHGTCPAAATAVSKHLIGAGTEYAQKMLELPPPTPARRQSWWSN